MSDPSLGSERGGFPITRWSLILAVGDSRSSAAAEALESLCRLYYKPVYGFIRSRCFSREDALDLTQGFFAHILERGLIRSADAQLGRFRSYLLGCAKRFVSNQEARAAAAKRGGQAKRLDESIEEVERWLPLAAPDANRPDVVYDYGCALALMTEALRLLKEECAAKDRAELFNTLRPYLQGDAASPNYQHTARALGTTPGTVAVTVHRLRARYRSLLRSVVAQTLADPLGVDDELRSLQAALDFGKSELA